MKTEIKNTIPFRVALNKMKNLGIYLKHVQILINDKMLIKEMKENLAKCQHIPCHGLEDSTC